MWMILSSIVYKILPKISRHTSTSSQLKENEKKKVTLKFSCIVAQIELYP